MSARFLRYARLLPAPMVRARARRARAAQAAAAQLQLDFRRHLEAGEHAHRWCTRAIELAEAGKHRAAAHARARAHELLRICVAIERRWKPSHRRVAT